MEEVRSVTDGPIHGKGKLLRNSNVTVIQIMPSERANRRTDKEIRSAEASDLEVITVSPISSDEVNNQNLLKLHILNVRTGKIQDAIISSEVGDYQKSLNKKPPALSPRNVGPKKEIVRIKTNSEQPDTVFKEISISKKFPLKPYKLRKKFTSSKCRCEENTKMWSCKKIQISIGRCRSDQLMCCNGY